MGEASGWVGSPNNDGLAAGNLGKARGGSILQDDQGRWIAVPSLFHFLRDASTTKLPSQLLREIYIMRSLSLRPWAVVFASGNEGEAALEI
ncbi:hypothetical protein CMV_020352 [Castanea mollissima]|uniref:Uncharacterized protein n=1 Tax=Castanea mollissima TaxID=60419 RepID=A0A8J4VLT1_9ROSI|nr:hypothetical protein CMV_020352 [Castanea mollissima]